MAGPWWSFVSDGDWGWASRNLGSPQVLEGALMAYGRLNQTVLLEYPQCSYATVMVAPKEEDPFLCRTKPCWWQRTLEVHEASEC